VGHRGVFIACAARKFSSSMPWAVPRSRRSRYVGLLRSSGMGRGRSIFSPGRQLLECPKAAPCHKPRVSSRDICSYERYAMVMGELHDWSIIGLIVIPDLCFCGEVIVPYRPCHVLVYDDLIICSNISAPTINRSLTYAKRSFVTSN